MIESIYVPRMRLVLIVIVALVAGCPNQTRNESRVAANRGNQKLGIKQFEEALTDYQKATELDKENHIAWYGMGAAFNGKNEPAKAGEAFSKAVDLAPDQAMYQMWLGVSLYNAEIKAAKEEQARKLNKKPEEIIDPDLAGRSFEKPLTHLQKAVQLNNDLWRAHTYLGRLALAQDKPKEAAEEYTKAIRGNPREYVAYVELAELYRRWDYTEAAIQIAKQGAALVPDANQLADVWFELGMGYDDKRMDEPAIDAFTKALENKKDYHRAKFQRGQAYFRKGDLTAAKRDLEEFSKAGGASLDFIKQQASKMLMDIAAKAAGTDKPAPKESPEETVKKGKGDKGKGGFKPPKK